MPHRRRQGRGHQDQTLAGLHRYRSAEPVTQLAGPGAGRVDDGRALDLALVGDHSANRASVAVVMDSEHGHATAHRAAALSHGAKQRRRGEHRLHLGVLRVVHGIDRRQA